MVRGKKVFLLMLILLCINMQYASAGDAEYSVYANKEPQDALLIGKVANIGNDGVMDIEILRVVCGQLEEARIKYCNQTAADNTSVGKYVLLSVEKQNDMYEKCFAVCHEVTIENTDKVSGIKPLDQAEDEEWEVSLQWFCNTGTTINGSKETGKYYEEKDGVVSKTLVYDLNEHKWYKDSLSSKYSSPNTQNVKASNPVFWEVLVFAFIALLFGMGVCFRKRDRKV